MMRLFSLLLPALIPSWRFFKTVEPSPRVQWAVVKNAPLVWQEFYPRPHAVSIGRMMRRMFWNPRWNEALFLVSLAERQTVSPNPSTVAEITARVAHHLRELGIADDETFQFRILYVYRDDAGHHQSVTYEGPLTPMSDLAR